MTGDDGRPGLRLLGLLFVFLLGALLPLHAAAAKTPAGRSSAIPGARDTSSVQSVASQQGKEVPLTRFVKNGGILLERDGKTVLSLNAATPFIPASILKIATSLAAFHVLGTDYRFQTEFFLTADHELIIKGYGDPTLVSEEIDFIAQELVRRGVTRIASLGLDTTAFALDDGKAPGTGTSLNPYEAANAPLAANYNTIHIIVDKDGSVRSAEEQTPLLPIMQRLGKTMAPGKHRIDISNTPRDVDQYVAELFTAMLGRHGVIVAGTVRGVKEGAGATGLTEEMLRTPVKARERSTGLAPLYVHTSRRSLREVIEGMLRYSNNFTANQIFLTMGAKDAGYPATWEKGRKALRNYLERQLGLGPDAVRIDEGSGISRANTITPQAMIRILGQFRPYARLLPGEGQVLVKSGTLNGVYCYAGYVASGSDSLQSFVIMLNQKENERDRLLELVAATILGPVKR